MTHDYDLAIRAAVATHWPEVGDWRWGKAQLIAESGLDPSAVSPAGAIGIAQFMPDTWDEVSEALFDTLATNPHDPVHAIEAYAYYMARQWHAWTTPRPWIDHLRLAQASYNCGRGYLLAAQRLAGGAAGYDAIIAQLPNVPHVDAQQVTRYVRRIERVFKTLTVTS